MEEYNTEEDNTKIIQLKTLLESNVDGIAIADVNKITGISYPTIMKYIEKWGYYIKKVKVKRYRTINIIKKRSD